LHPGTKSRRDVLGAVVHEDARPPADPLEDISIDTLVRLRQPYEPGQHDRLEAAHEREPAIEKADVLRRIVRQRVQTVPALRKRFEARDGLVEYPGEHPLPLAAIAQDPVRMPREPLRERARLAIERRAAIEACVPFRRADLREKRIDLTGIAGKVIAKQVPRIPVDENAAEIEDDVADARPRHQRAFTAGTPRPPTTAPRCGRLESLSDSPAVPQRRNPRLDRRMRVQEPHQARHMAARDPERLHRLRQPAVVRPMDPPKALERRNHVRAPRKLRAAGVRAELPLTREPRDDHAGEDTEQDLRGDRRDKEAGPVTA